MELARDGTGLLYQLPADVAISVWRNWRSGWSRGQNPDECLWLDALFELSWQRQPGDALHSKRCAWLENVSVALFGEGLLPRLPDDPSLLPPTSIPHENGYPVAHYSRLSDVARASVAAIDELLDRGRTATGTEQQDPDEGIVPLPGQPAMQKTVVELDLKGYSDIARELEEHFSAEVVMCFNDQIQGFVDAGLKAVGAPHEQSVMATTGDGAILIFDQPETAHRFAEAVHHGCRVHNDGKSIASARRWFRVGIATGGLALDVPRRHRHWRPRPGCSASASPLAASPWM